MKENKQYRVKAVNYDGDGTRIVETYDYDDYNKAFNKFFDLMKELAFEKELKMYLYKHYDNGKYKTIRTCKMIREY